MPAVPAPIPGNTAPVSTQFNPNNPIGTPSPASQGYNAAIQNLTNASNLAGNTTSGQLNALSQQYQQNQSNTQQQLINSGLGNSTILNSAEQAPLQSYNQGVLNTENQGNLLQMNALQSLANTEAQGGNALQNYGNGLPASKIVVPGQNYNFNPQPSSSNGIKTTPLQSTTGATAAPANSGYMGDLSGLLSYLYNGSGGATPDEIPAGSVGSITDNDTGQTTDYGAGGDAVPLQAGDSGDSDTEGDIYDDTENT